MPLEPHEAELFGAISDEERAAWWYPRPHNAAQREADRLLWAKVEVLLAEGVRYSVLGQGLGVSTARLDRLRHHHQQWGLPVWTEKQIAEAQVSNAQHEAERKAERIADQKAMKARHREVARQRRAEARQRERDEAREISAQSLHCLIEAYEEMRGHPTVGPHALALTHARQ